MSSLGDFLEVVYGHTDRFQTLRTCITQRQNRSLLERALTHTVDGNQASTTSPSAAQVAQIWETNICVWINGDKLARVEKTYLRGGRVETSLVVVNGDRWWERDHKGRVEVGGPGQGQIPPFLPEVKRHFFSSLLRECFVSLLLKPLGPATTAGRECVRVRATPRPNCGVWRHWLPLGADEYELHADPVLGVLPYISGSFRGEVFETSSVLELAFDEQFDPGVFTFEHIPGEQVTPAQPIVEHLTLAAAIARVPFKILIPTRIPDPDHATFEVMYHHPRPSAGSWQYLQLLYRTGHLSLTQSATPAPLKKGSEWQQIERSGQQMIISEPGVGTRFIRLECLGTHIEIQSNLDREQLIDLAASLAPVS